jgi:hypothetical protein
MFSRPPIMRADDAPGGEQEVNSPDMTCSAKVAQGAGSEAAGAGVVADEDPAPTRAPTASPPSASPPAATTGADGLSGDARNGPPRATVIEDVAPFGAGGDPPGFLGGVEGGDPRGGDDDRPLSGGAGTHAQHWSSVGRGGGARYKHGERFDGGGYSGGFCGADGDVDGAASPHSSDRGYSSSILDVGGGKLRIGKWTPEEERYTAAVINDFNRGLLPLESGTTLRTHLRYRARADLIQ